LGLRVRGKVAPETVKPIPVKVTALTVTAAVPVEDRVSDWVAGEFRSTSPKAMVVAFTLSVGVGSGVGVAAPTCRAKVSASCLRLRRR
jgi:hypothetical protein